MFRFFFYRIFDLLKNTVWYILTFKEITHASKKVVLVEE